MCYKRIKGKIFLVRKGMSKIGECHAISFLQLYDREQFKAVFLMELSTEIESKIESCRCKSVW